MNLALSIRSFLPDSKNWRLEPFNTHYRPFSALTVSYLPKPFRFSAKWTLVVLA